MSKIIICPKCKGKGQTGISVSPLIVVATLGLGALADTSEDCDGCGGKGYFWDDSDVNA